MKTLCKLLIFPMFLLIPLYCFAEIEDDGYFMNDNSKEYLGTSVDENNDDIISSKEKNIESRTEKKEDRFDIEISPYISVRYVSINTTIEDY